MSGRRIGLPPFTFDTVVNVMEELMEELEEADSDVDEAAIEAFGICAGYIASGGIPRRKCYSKSEKNLQLMHARDFESPEEHFVLPLQDLERLLKALGTSRREERVLGRKVTTEHAVLVVLARMTSGMDLTGLGRLFCRDSRSISAVFIWGCDWLLSKFEWLLTNIGQWRPRMPHYNAAVNGLFERKCPGVVLPSRIWGFIDCVVFKIARPSAKAFPGMNMQRRYYSGHGRKHCIKLQAISLPDGLIAHVWGPIEGRRHDETLRFWSSVLVDIDACFGVGDTIYQLLADTAYTGGPYITKGFKATGQRPLSSGEKKYNRSLSKARIAVEWSFADLANRFCRYLRMSRKLKLGETRLYIVVRVGVILSNCITCLRPGLTATYFNCEPPEIEEYLRCE